MFGQHGNCVTRRVLDHAAGSGATAPALHIPSRPQNLRQRRGARADDSCGVRQRPPGTRGGTDPDPRADGQERQHKRTP